MKILVSRGSAAVFGGAELSAHDHAYSYQKLGHQVVFASGLKKLSGRTKASDIKTHNLLWPNKYEGLIRLIYYVLATPVFWLQCIYLSLRYRPDLYNPHSREDWIAFTLLKWLHKKPVIWRDPADLRHYLKDEPRGFLARFNRHLLLKALQKTDQVITLNDHEKKSIIKHAAGAIEKDRVSVVSSNIVFDQYDLDAAAPKQTDKLVLGTASLLHEQKGLQYLLSAYKKLNKTHSNLEIWIVGNGPYQAQLEELAGNDKNIVFWGFQNDVSPFMNRYDIFVQPAEFEGWGRNVKEAMYFNRAVVGSNIGGIAKQVDHNKTGLLFEDGDVSQLTERLETLISDEKLRHKLGQAAGQKASADGDYVALIETKVLPLFEKFL